MTTLREIRPLGDDELYFTLRNDLGFYHSVAQSIQLTIPSLPDDGLLQPIYATLASVMKRHPILFAVPVCTYANEPPISADEQSQSRAVFEQLSQINLQDVVTLEDAEDTSAATQSSQGTTFDKSYDSFLENIHNTPFKKNKAQWKVILLRSVRADASEQSDFNLKVSFVYHHAIGDGLSGLVFLQDFVNILAEVLQSGKHHEYDQVVSPGEKTLLQPLVSLRRCSKVILSTEQDQAKEAIKPNPGTLWLGKDPVNRFPATTRFTSYTFSAQATKRLLSRVACQKTSVTPFLQTLLAASILHMAPETYEHVSGFCSINLRPYIEESLEDVMGSFVAGCRMDYDRCQFRYSSDDSNGGIGIFGTEFWERVQKNKTDLLRAVDKSVKGLSTEEASSDAATDPSKMLNWMKNLVGAPRNASFDLNNLGKFSCAKKDRMKLGRVVFSASQPVIGSALKVNVVTGPNGDMTVGFAWQKEVHDEKTMYTIIDKFRRGIEESALE